MRGRKPDADKTEDPSGVFKTTASITPSRCPHRAEPEPPEHLDKLAKEEWERICDLLKR